MNIKRDTTTNNNDTMNSKTTWESTKGQDTLLLKTCQKWVVFIVDGNKIILTEKMKQKNLEEKFSQNLGCWVPRIEGNNNEINNSF